MGMRLCCYPDCPRWTRVKRCYYHDKLHQGLFAGYTPVVRRHVLESAVLDDEQLELAHLLDRMGADPGEIKTALTRSN